EASTRLRELSLAGVKQAEIAEDLTFGAPVAQLAGQGKRRLVARSGFGGPAEGVVDDSLVAQHDAFGTDMPDFPHDDKRRLELLASFLQPSPQLGQQDTGAERTPLHSTNPDLG